ncbi:MAG: serine/threonine protein kinase [Planctomycetota bacterium]
MLQKTEPIRGDDAPSPDDLAAEFLALRSSGETADESAFLGRLKNDAARKEFQGLIAAAGCAERGLPRAITGGTLLAGRYRILETMGEGGMGRVFSAVDEKLGCQVAVKLLNPLSQGNREREELFQKESRVLAELKHPGIVAVHDAGRDGSYMYIVMDLVHGSSVGEVLDKARSHLVLGARGNKLPPRDGSLLTRAIGRPVPDGRGDLVEPKDWYRSCAKILLEIARTLEAAHGKKVVHRDLKPQNVMLQGGGNPIILDFGLAGSPELSTGMVTENLYGSVCYLAPEQASSQKIGMDPRTDVYQLGLILYEMLTLRRAFPGQAIGEVLQRIGAGFYELPSKVDPRVPRDLEAICTMALEVKPERRYAGARELREDLGRWLEGRAPIASRSAHWRSLVRTTRYTARRHPVLSAAAAVVLALGVGFVIWSGGEASGTVLRPFRFNEATAEKKMLPETGAEVREGEWLCVNHKNSRENWVYTLSQFGAVGEERQVMPWKTSFTDDPNRALQPKLPGESWGLRVPPTEGEEGGDLLCTKILQDSAPGTIEGLIVLASPVQRPDIELWMDTIAANKGMPYSTSMRALQTQMESIPRGVPPKPDGSFTREEALEFAKKLREAPPAWDAPRVGLPGVEERRVECRVAPK